MLFPFHLESVGSVKIGLPVSTMVWPHVKGARYEILTICMLGDFSCFFMVDFLQNSFRDAIRVSNSLVWVQTVCKA